MLVIKCLPLHESQRRKVLYIYILILIITVAYVLLKKYLKNVDNALIVPKSQQPNKSGKNTNICVGVNIIKLFNINKI